MQFMGRIHRMPLPMMASSWSGAAIGKILFFLIILKFRQFYVQRGRKEVILSETYHNFERRFQCTSYSASRVF